MNVKRRFSQSDISDIALKLKGHRIFDFSTSGPTIGFPLISENKAVFFIDSKNGNDLQVFFDNTKTPFATIQGVISKSKGTDCIFHFLPGSYKASKLSGSFYFEDGVVLLTNTTLDPLFCDDVAKPCRISVKEKGTFVCTQQADT